LGYASAYYNLGIIYAGGSNDFVAAGAAFFQGATLGHRGCELMLGILYATTPPVADDIKAYGWLSLSLTRNPSSQPVLARELLDRVKQRITIDQRQKADGYLADLKAKYGSIAAFQP
jgi:TPR repeat protein